MEAPEFPFSQSGWFPTFNVKRPFTFFFSFRVFLFVGVFFGGLRLDYFEIRFSTKKHTKQDTFTMEERLKVNQTHAQPLKRA